MQTETIDITVAVEDFETVQEVLGIANSISKRNGVRGLEVEHYSDNAMIDLSYEDQSQ